LRIAFAAAQLDASLGGVERYAYGLACGLARRGAQVTAFTARPPPGPLPAGLSVEVIDLPVGPRGARERRYDAAVRARIGDLSRWDVVQGFGPTTLHTHHRIGGGSHAAYLQALARYEPVKALAARARPLHRERIVRERRILQGPGVLLANSERSRRDACRDAGIDPERVHVIHNGVDLAAFRAEADPRRRQALRSRRGLPVDALAVAFVGSGFARKGLRFAIEMLTAARARGARVELVVAGRGRAAPYRRLARRRGVEGAVHFAGRVDDVASLYAACDAFLLPSLYEAFGNAALEAMACGLPVAVPRQSGVAELLRDGREGCLLLGPDDVRRGAAFLEALARDPERRRALGAGARATAEAHDLERHVDRVLELYRLERG
jgi:UDP-glucose:(heptosyl)LPS alpha-1,3-glucosyltransferase